MKLLNGIKNDVGRILSEEQQLVSSSKPLDRIFDRGEAPVKRVAQMTNEDVGLVAVIDSRQVYFSNLLRIQCLAQFHGDESLVRPRS